MKARALLEEGRLDNCLGVLKEHWLKKPGDSATILLFSQLLKQMQKNELAESLAVLADSVKREDSWDERRGELWARQVFETGYQLIDIRLYDLAVMLMRRCLDESPDDPTLNYELGFALMSLGRYEDAIKHFDTVAQEHEDFDTVLNLAVCFSLTRQLRRTKSAISSLDKLAKSDDEKLELLHRKMVLQRLDQLRWKQDLTARDWMYCLYGSILAVESDAKPEGPGPAVRGIYNTREETHTSIARTLLIVKGVLDGLRLTPEAIEFYSPTSRPLAAILARLFDLPLDSYRGPDRPDQALLVMDWAPEIIGPHDVFSSNQNNRTIFAYGMSSNQPLPLTPDMVAYLSDALTLPWKIHRKSDGVVTPELSVSDEPDPDESIPLILEKAWNMESEPRVMQIIGDTVSYYADKRDYCVYGNPTRFSQRPEFSAEIPVISE